MNLNTSLLANLLALVTAFAPTAFSAENTVTFQVWTLAKVRFIDMKTNKETVFTPKVTGTNDEGDLKGIADVSIPEGIYLVYGDEHMPAELGTVCRITDRVIHAKPVVEATALKSEAFGYASNKTGLGSFKQVCWEDFGAIGRVPDFRAK